MPEGGVLDFKLNAAGEAVVLTVCDTGVGMTEQQINRLGTPYYSTKEKRNRSRHHGIVWYHQKDGRENRYKERARKGHGI